MALSRNLLAQLGWATLRPGELASVLLDEFSYVEEDGQQQLYFSDGREPALRLNYNRKGSLYDVRAGPQLEEMDVARLSARVEEELVSSSGLAVGTRKLFSDSRRLNGYWRYRDRFQVLPAPENAPDTGQAIGPHPFLLQFTFSGSSNQPINSARQWRESRRLELLLCALINHPITSISPIYAAHWVYSPDFTETVYAQEGYSIPNFVPPTGFLAVEGMDPAPEQPEATYYAFGPLDFGPPLAVPTTLATLLDIFFNLSPFVQDQFLRAAYWLQHSHRVSSISHSASYMALIGAIEVLTEKAGEACPTCRQPVFSVGQRFREFLDEYAPLASGIDPDVAKARTRLYGTRSKITHGERLLLIDDDPVTFTLGPNAILERETFRHAWESARVGLVNWLRRQAEPAG